MTEQLKTLMDRAADQDFAAVDLDAITGAGDRTVRRRQIATGVAGVAVLAVVATGAALLGGDDGDRKTDFVDDPFRTDVPMWTEGSTLHTPDRDLRPRDRRRSPSCARAKASSSPVGSARRRSASTRSPARASRGGSVRPTIRSCGPTPTARTRVGWTSRATTSEAVVFDQSVRRSDLERSGPDRGLVPDRGDRRRVGLPRRRRRAPDARRRPRSGRGDATWAAAGRASSTSRAT